MSKKAVEPCVLNNHGRDRQKTIKMTIFFGMLPLGNPPTHVPEIPVFHVAMAVSLEVWHQEALGCAAFIFFNH